MVLESISDISDDEDDNECWIPNLMDTIQCKAKRKVVKKKAAKKKAAKKTSEEESSQQIQKNNRNHVLHHYIHHKLLVNLDHTIEVLLL